MALTIRINRDLLLRLFLIRIWDGKRMRTSNIGFDARLFGRLSVAFDFYNRETKDLLQDVPVSMTTGFNNTLKNVGAMNNRGMNWI